VTHSYLIQGNSNEIVTHPQRALGHKSAFTLIELLVVIAILAVILFPVFGRARENARRSSCQSNMKQIALGVLQYTQDYDEKFPGLFSNGVYWNQTLDPYLKSIQIFQCPSITGAYISNLATSPSRPSYGMNASMGAAPSGIAGISQASVNNAAELVMLADNYLEAKPNQCDGWSKSSIVNDGGFSFLWWDTTEARAGVANPVTPGGPSKNAAGPDARHLGGANAAFADGHVKWINYSKLYNSPTGVAAPYTTWRQWYSDAP